MGNSLEEWQEAADYMISLFNCLKKKSQKPEKITTEYEIVRLMLKNTDVGNGNKNMKAATMFLRHRYNRTLMPSLAKQIHHEYVMEIENEIQKTQE